MSKNETRHRRVPKERKAEFRLAILNGATDFELSRRFRVEGYYIRQVRDRLLARVMIKPTLADEIGDEADADARGEMTPTEYALRLLAGRAQAMPQSMFKLDGRLVSARDVVRAANAVLVEHGRAAMAYPGLPA